jgi:hypothetical protein
LQTQCVVANALIVYAQRVHLSLYPSPFAQTTETACSNERATSRDLCLIPTFCLYIGLLFAATYLLLTRYPQIRTLCWLFGPPYNQSLTYTYMAIQRSIILFIARNDTWIEYRRDVQRGVYYLSVSIVTPWPTVGSRLCAITAISHK